MTAYGLHLVVITNPRLTSPVITVLLTSGYQSACYGPELLIQITDPWPDPLPCPTQCIQPTWPSFPDIQHWPIQLRTPASLLPPATLTCSARHITLAWSAWPRTPDSSSQSVTLAHSCRHVIPACSDCSKASFSSLRTLIDFPSWLDSRPQVGQSALNRLQPHGSFFHQFMLPRPPAGPERPVLRLHLHQVFCHDSC